MFDFIHFILFYFVWIGYFPDVLSLNRPLFIFSEDDENNFIVIHLKNRSPKKKIKLKNNACLEELGTLIYEFLAILLM